MDLGIDPGAMETFRALASELAGLSDAAALETALASVSPDVRDRLALAQYLIEAGGGATAVRLLEDSVARAPDSADAVNALGSIHRKLGHHRASADCFEKAVALQPDNRALRFNLALAVLSQGDLERGWPLYEEGRNLVNRRADAFRRYPFPEWRGEDVAGKGLYLWAEQGVGDVILFGSMIGDLQARGASCVIECDRRLIPLLRRSFPGLAAVAAGPLSDLGLGGRQFDYHAPLGSLGRFLRPSLAAFPPPRAFLTADRRRVAACRERLAALGGGRKIGISWESKSAYYDAKSTRLREWAPIFAVPDTRFVNLQYGDVRAELAAVERQLGVAVFDHPEIDKREDIDGLAALVAACDLVVTVSNVTAHIAAGQGKATFQILGPETMWYWFQDRPDSPWYPDLRQVRAAVPYRWDDAIAAVAKALRALPNVGQSPAERAGPAVRRKRRPRIVRARPKA